MISQYHIKTDQFEGPLGLLLELIEKNKLDVTRLSIARVADDYLEYLEREPQVDLGQLSEFLLVASQLILLKSKALLPLFEFTQEEDAELDDLEQRLKEYQRFKQAAIDLKTLYQEGSVCFSKDEEDISLVTFIAPAITPAQLHGLFVRVVETIPTQQQLQQEVVEDVISLEDKIIHLRSTLEQRIQFAFHEAVQQATDKIDVIVTFLAMLEMVKQKIISVQQQEMFGEIILHKRHVVDSLPHLIDKQL